MKRLQGLTFGAGLIVLLAACSGTGAASESVPIAPTTAPSSAPSAVAPSASAEASASLSEAPSASTSATVSLKTTSLGAILVDAQGKTLYMWENDKNGKPSCYDACAAKWPALTVTGTPAAGTGVDASKLTTVARTDGTTQVKYGEYPLYYFASDTAAGDTKGQGIGNVWFVVGADGEPIKK